jgi:hypothetical protein
MNLSIFKKKEILLKKKFLKEKDKNEVYVDLCEFSCELSEYLSRNEYTFSLVMGKLNPKLISINSIKRSVNGMTNSIERANYIEWIKCENKAFLHKIAHGYDRRLEVYDRPSRFELKSIKDPLTSDEIMYVISFANDVYKGKSYKDLSSIPFSCVKIALSSLLSN